MQIREISLKELDNVYDIVKELYLELSYKEFEDLIYDMRDINYQMFGVFEREKLITYAGVVVLTTLKDGRHLKVFDFITSKRYDKVKYDAIMEEYLTDYAKVGMCEGIKYED